LKVKDIKYKWFVQSDLEKYGKVLIVESQDGTLYRISPSSPRSEHPKFTPEDGTEPNFLIVS
jgi:hypothetical protein